MPAKFKTLTILSDYMTPYSPNCFLKFILIYLNGTAVSSTSPLSILSSGSVQIVSNIDFRLSIYILI